ncbi:FixH family protein [Nitratiruptor tergarcus]|uniref:YtkA-like domain-containing protein n=1 Tax=Nitratiruptor tergarcus DSM 16512 TaxID=1069081 RepID=A0A1W1WR05_9BACT|nr:FixH family protein [Nitratiruptor tergarcus]SMC08450.1 hypothetical protein SAMN05660197_0202 [Nitratiruptor tergarcus DSM 16512]
MNKNYWPHFIIGLVLFAIGLGVWTVKTAIDNPVELDDTYMMKYQQVDKNIYNIMKMKKEFSKKYKVVLLTTKLDYPNATFQFKILTKDGKPVSDAKAMVLFTRPDTSKYDIKKNAEVKNGMYTVRVKLPLAGRWNVLLKIEEGKLTVYEKYKLSTLREMKKLKNS